MVAMETSFFFSPCILDRLLQVALYKSATIWDQE